MIVNGPPRAVVIECNRRCGSRFVREVYDGERDRDACARAVWDANVAGWREMRGRGVRCAGCVQRYGEGERIMATTMHDALTALFECASKCDACREHVAVRRGEDIFTGGHHVCDREACGDWMRCERCNETSSVSASVVSEGVMCPLCQCAPVIREPRSTSWADLPHADVLRAANAAHEARR